MISETFEKQISGLLVRQVLMRPFAPHFIHFVRGSVESVEIPLVTRN